MRKRLIAGLAGAAIVPTVVPAAAADIPNLVGTWKGMAKAVLSDEQGRRLLCPDQAAVTAIAFPAASTKSQSLNQPEE